MEKERLSSDYNTPAKVKRLTGSPGAKIVPTESKNEQVNVWKIGKREVMAMLVGTILCISLSDLALLLIRLSLQLAQPNNQTIVGIVGIVAVVLIALASGAFLFLGTVYGPWVGLFVGEVGFFIGAAIFGALQFPDFWYFDIGFAVAGFIAGLALLVTRGRYNKFRFIAAAVGISIIGLYVGVSIFLVLEGNPFSQAPIWQVLLIAFIPALPPSLIPLPIMLVVYNRIVSRRKRA